MILKIFRWQRGLLVRFLADGRRYLLGGFRLRR